MANDGCDEVAWKGQAFPYLMHRPDPRSHSYGDARAAPGSPLFSAANALAVYRRRCSLEHLVMARPAQRCTWF